MSCSTPPSRKPCEPFRDVFGWDHVDDGDGWLIFALPPPELGIHPSEAPTFDSGARHQLTLMCDDISATVEELRGKGVEVRGEPENEGFGITTTLVLPGGPPDAGRRLPATRR